MVGGTSGKGWGLNLKTGAVPWVEGGTEGPRIGKSGGMDEEEVGGQGAVEAAVV